MAKRSLVGSSFAAWLLLAAAALFPIGESWISHLGPLGVLERRQWSLVSGVAGRALTGVPVELSPGFVIPTVIVLLGALCYLVVVLRGGDVDRRIAQWVNSAVTAALGSLAFLAILLSASLPDQIGAEIELNLALRLPIFGLHAMLLFATLRALQPASTSLRTSLESRLQDFRSWAGGDVGKRTLRGLAVVLVVAGLSLWLVLRKSPEELLLLEMRDQVIELAGYEVPDEQPYEITIQLTDSFCEEVIILHSVFSPKDAVAIDSGDVPSGHPIETIELVAEYFEGQEGNFDFRRTELSATVDGDAAARTLRWKGNETRARVTAIASTQLSMALSLHQKCDEPGLDVEWEDPAGWAVVDRFSSDGTRSDS